ncbi:MAG: UDP-N-acetylglucosamine 2-epimerase (non-hydrolyzing) [Phaeodactylibacter sp.]|nr:UDP-N-acetylglucosamine 2-epimerase (non-hydrolyzing) [Phaeodactylibacter sp.]MCB9274528.1 UDP-N-acetylglucosamine 2-epimerase (non-hydrolyzing) [Lewinellaceae bacterium]
MNKGNLLFVVGARPNFIKIAPLCAELSKRSGLPFRIVHTGQHYDKQMSDVFFEELQIPQPDFHLNIGSGGHGQQSGAMMMKLEELCLGNAFSAIVVIGDVNSTLAGALVGAKLHIPVAHVEAGLRSFNRAMPEEVNRVVADHVSDWLFAPTQLAMHNLANEGLASRAYFSGDVMYDMILKGLELAREKSDILRKLELEPRQYYLATLHRPYNVDDPDCLKNIIGGLAGLEKPVVLAAHPRLRKNLSEFGIRANGNIRLTEPFGYLDFIMLEKEAVRVVTDSGGVQKEAFFLKTPCLTLRPETEWVETVDAGANVLVRQRTTQAILDAAGQSMSPRYDEQPYGGGNASERIVDVIESELYS